MSRTEKERIAELQAQIDRLKERAAGRQAKSAPTFRHMSKAIKSIDAAMASSADQAVHLALREARATLTTCIQLKVVLIPRSDRASGPIDELAIIAFVQKNPGQRAEHIAAALGTDSKAIRGLMRQLIAERRIRTKGERQGMQYWAG